MYISFVVSLRSSLPHLKTAPSFLCLLPSTVFASSLASTLFSKSMASISLHPDEASSWFTHKAVVLLDDWMDLA